MLPIEGTATVTATSSYIGLQAPVPDFITPIRYIYTTLTGNDWGAFADRVEFWWDIYSFFAILISIVFFIGFVYARIRFEQLFAIEMEQLLEAERKWAAKHAQGKSKSGRWEAIQAKVTANSPEGWRIAIIEADILLDEALSNAGFTGGSLGEKLKSANTHSFTSLQDAWEAHKVRNEIAHVGSDFVLTQKAAQDAILRFERALRELGAI